MARGVALTTVLAMVVVACLCAVVHRLRQQLGPSAIPCPASAKVPPINSTITIMGLLRDVGAKRARAGVRRALRVGSVFRECHVVVLENDSADDTWEGLRQASEQHPNVHVLSMDTSFTPTLSARTGLALDSSDRIHKMATLRNVLLDRVRRTPELARSDVLAVMDMDLVGDVCLRGVEDAARLLAADRFDCVFASAYTVLGRYFDMFAHRELGEPVEFAGWSDKAAHDARMGREPPFHRLKFSSPLRVAAGFNGLALYRGEAALRARYRAGSGAKVTCEHTAYQMDAGMRVAQLPHMAFQVAHNPRHWLLDAAIQSMLGV